MNLPGWPRIMDRDMTKAYCGGLQTLVKLKQKGLKPFINQRGCVRYDRHLVDARLDSLKPEDFSSE